MIDLSKVLNFHGPEWSTLKLYLEEQRNLKVRQLIGSSDHDASQKLRGTIEFIELLLRQEEAALRAARG